VFLNTNYIYQLKDVSFSYTLNSHQIEALSHLTLDIHKQSIVTFTGPSGSGKSTLLNILGLIEVVQTGQVLFQNEDFLMMSSTQRDEIRKFKLGFIFQQFHLIPVFTAKENVEYFLVRQGLSKEVIEERVRESLEAVGLWNYRMNKPSELSGGQKQRVAIARALAKKPQVIIGDEPSASLDQKSAEEIMVIFSDLVKHQNVSIILSTHDKLIQSYAEQNFFIKDGKLVS
jgi:putative ABC transport system ATP-binding protein